MPVPHPPPARRAGVALLFVLLAAWVGCAAASAQAPAVSWEKDPPLIQATLTQADQVFSFDEVMLNQTDPSGLGGFTFTVKYDATIWQAPGIDLTAAINLFAASGRSLSCWPASSAPGSIQMVCASTGTLASGPVWTGPQVLATVQLTLLPSIANTILSDANGGLTTTINDVAVQVTNTCGQALNDGTIQPLPGQPECQGNLLPGLGPGGVVLNPGSTTITVLPPPTPTATMTPPPTQTRTPQPTSTRTGVPTVTRTAYATQTAVTRTATAPAATSTVERTTTAVPTRTSTAVASTATVAATTATARATQSPAPNVTATPGAGDCDRGPDYWLAHEDAWPIQSLQLGGQTYSRVELRSLLADSDRTDASVMLARELIAAKFNLARGAADGTSDYVVQGDSQLAAVPGRLPFHLSAVEPATYLARGMTWTAASLAELNRRCPHGGASSGSAEPTPVTGVLGASRHGSSPSGLPLTGTLGSLGKSPAGVVITLLSLLVVVLLVTLVRVTVFDQRDR